MSRTARAFSLLEMVVVIAIIAIVSAFAVPAFSSLVNGTTLNQASSMLTNQLNLARQYATTKNRSVEVRLLRFRDPEMPGEGGGSQGPGQFRAIQLMEVLEAGVAVPFGKMECFPQAIVLCPDVRSSLLDGAGTASQISRTPTATDGELPRGIQRNYTFVSFRFLPNGSTTLAANHNWFMTVLALKDLNANTQLPANYFIVQIDPVSGSTRNFRPNLR
jgi:uncharacterized protein (TIGR02596 family)